MTTPAQQLMWAQAGVYNAPDDRLVITALSGGNTGTIRPAVLNPGAGLAVNVLGGWLAIAKCSDNTTCVISSSNTVTINALSGPSSGSARTDYVWADVDKDAGTWSLRVVSASNAPATGVRLATITVGAGVTSAQNMGFEGAAPVPTFSSPSRARIAFAAPTTAVTASGGVSGQYATLASVSFSLNAAADLLFTAWAQALVAITGSAQRRTEIVLTIDGGGALALNNSYPDYPITVGISGTYQTTLAAGTHTALLQAYAQNVSWSFPANTANRQLAVSRLSW